MNGSNHSLDRAKESLMQRRSEVLTLAVTDLFVDPRFQRPLNPHHSAKIRSEYHPQGLGFILVATVINDDGTPATGDGGQRYAVLDGQTRWRAIQDLLEDGDGTVKPEDTLKAEVFTDLTEEEAAALFALRNDQKPVRPEDRDRIAFAAGDPIMKEVIRQSADAGYRLYSDNPDAEPVNMPHREHAKRVVTWGKKAGRPDLLAETLIIQSKAFGSDVGYLNRDLMTATARMLLRHPNLNEDEMVRVLSVIGLPGIVGQAEQEAARTGKRMSGAMEIVLRERYNKGKRGQEILRVR
jgi:hypothetical protein